MNDKDKTRKTGMTQKEIPVVCQRIRYFREKKHMEQKALAAELGIISNAVSNWENGRSRPDIASLPKICQILGVTMDELFDLPAAPQPTITVTSKTPVVTGDDELLGKYHRLNKGHRSVVDSLLDKLGDVEDEELYNSICEETRFSKQLAAGYDPGEEFDDKGQPILLYKEKIDPRMDCIFPVSGDSMEPEFHDGDLVMVQRMKNGSDLDPGEIGAFIVGNETYIKQYRKAGLRSLNPKYKMMRFSEDEQVFVIGRVLGVLDPEAVVSYEESIRYEKVKARLENEE